MAEDKTDEGLSYYPSSVIFEDAVRDSELIKTPENNLDLTSVEKGDVITLEFYSAPGSLKKIDPLFIEVVQRAERKGNQAGLTAACMGLAKAGPFKWEGPQKVTIVGTRLNPDSTSLALASINPSGSIELEIYDESLRIKQLKGEEPIETPFGSVSVNDINRDKGLGEKGAKRLTSFWAGKRTLILPPLAVWKLARKEK